MTETVLTENMLVSILPSVYARAFDREVVLLDFGRGEYFALDEVGAFVWRMLETGTSLRHVAEAVTTQWDVGLEQAMRDVVELVEQLARESLVVLTPRP
jgi:hypothetical protein